MSTARAQDRGSRARLPVVLVLAAGCAYALAEPPAPVDLPGGAAAGDASNARVARAELEFARRDLEGARRAAELWSLAAAHSNRPERWIEVTRARLWLADHEPEAKARRLAAKRAVEAAESCGGELEPRDVRCAYWLALALGMQARERRLTALGVLPRMIELLERAAAEQPELDHGGPARVLALVRLRAPGWPLGPGDAESGLAAAREAARIEPDWPPNLLVLAEALAENGSDGEADELRRRAALAARAAVARGEPDAAEWLAEALGEARPVPAVRSGAPPSRPSGGASAADSRPSPMVE